jgi:hypothetical protein
MGYLVSALAALAACAVLLVVLGPGVVLTVGLGGLVVGALLLGVVRCRHPHPALHPPTVDFQGRRHPPHWYCDDCGKTWDAVFNHDAVPVQRFTGYDQSKAVDAARRADHVERELRRLAASRSGLIASRSEPGPPVPISSRRLAR